MPSKEYKLKGIKLGDESARLHPLRQDNCLYILQKHQEDGKKSATGATLTAKTQFSTRKKRSNTLLLIRFLDPGVPNAP
jgi:hypothetical protein